MSLKIKPLGKRQSAKPNAKLATVCSGCSQVQDAKGVAGTGVHRASNGLAYPMVLLLKRFLITLKRGEQVVEAQRQKLAGLPEFEPHAAF